MSRLTWQNIGTPDFTPAIEAQRGAAAAIQQALGGFGGALTRFDDLRSEEQNKEFALRLAAFTDADQLAAAQASGALFEGFDPRRLTEANIAAPRTTAGMLLGQAGDRLRNVQTSDQINNTRDDRFELERKRAAEAEISPIAAEVFRLRSSGDDAGAALLEATIAPKLGALGMEATGNFYQTGQGLSSGAFTMEKGRFDFGETKDAVREADLADNLWMKIDREAFDGDSARTMLYQNPEVQAAPANVQAALLGRINSTYGAQSAPSRIAGAAGGGGAIGSGAIAAGADTGVYDTVLGYGRYGSPDVPFSQMTGRQAIQFGREVLIPNTRNNAQLGLEGTNKGSSAMGAYQFTGGTLEEYMPKILADQGGIDAPLTPQNQERLAEAIFNDRKGGNLRETWASLPDTRPGAYAGKSWAEMRQIIASGEVRGRLPSLASPEAAMAANLIGDEVGALGPNGQGGNDTNKARGYAAAIGNEGLDINQVAAGLIAPGGAMAGSTITQARSAIRTVQARTGNQAPSVAAWAIGNNLRRTNPVGNFLGSAVFGRFGFKSKPEELNMDAIVSDITTARENGWAQNVVSDATREQGQALNAQAQAQLIDAQARYDAALNRQRLTGSTADLSGLRADVLAAQQRAAQAAGGIINGQTPYRRPAAAAPRAPVSYPIRQTPVRSSSQPLRQSPVNAPVSGDSFNEWLRNR